MSAASGPFHPTARHHPAVVAGHLIQKLCQVRREPRLLVLRGSPLLRWSLCRQQNTCSDPLSTIGESSRRGIGNADMQRSVGWQRGGRQARHLIATMTLQQIVEVTKWRRLTQLMLIELQQLLQEDPHTKPVGFACMVLHLFLSHVARDAIFSGVPANTEQSTKAFGNQLSGHTIGNASALTSQESVQKSHAILRNF